MTRSADLDALAAVWVERWLMYGGGLIADLDAARVSISMSFDNWRWKHGSLHQRQWHDGWITGRWRELNDLANLIPGLREAIVDHVAEHGEPAGPKHRQMYRRAEHVGWRHEAEQSA